jgi:hypothetical protein
MILKIEKSNDVKINSIIAQNTTNKTKENSNAISNVLFATNTNDMKNISNTLNNWAISFNSKDSTNCDTTNNNNNVDNNNNNFLKQSLSKATFKLDSIQNNPQLKQRKKQYLLSNFISNSVILWLHPTSFFPTLWNEITDLFYCNNNSYINDNKNNNNNNNTDENDANFNNASNDAFFNNFIKRYTSQYSSKIFSDRLYFCIEERALTTSLFLLQNKIENTNKCDSNFNEEDDANEAVDHDLMKILQVSNYYYYYYYYYYYFILLASNCFSLLIIFVFRKFIQVTNNLQLIKILIN